MSVQCALLQPLTVCSARSTSQLILKFAQNFAIVIVIIIIIITIIIIIIYFSETQPVTVQDNTRRMPNTVF